MDSAKKESTQKPFKLPRRYTILFAVTIPLFPLYYGLQAFLSLGGVNEGPLIDLQTMIYHLTSIAVLLVGCVFIVEVSSFRMSHTPTGQKIKTWLSSRQSSQHSPNTESKEETPQP